MQVKRLNFPITYIFENECRILNVFHVIFFCSYFKIMSMMMVMVLVTMIMTTMMNVILNLYLYVRIVSVFLLWLCITLYRYVNVFYHSFARNKILVFMLKNYKMTNKNKKTKTKKKKITKNNDKNKETKCEGINEKRTN